MELLVEKAGDVTVVVPKTEFLDANTSREFKDDLPAAVSEGGKVVLDLSHVQFMDSGGCGIPFDENLAPRRRDVSVKRDRMRGGSVTLRVSALHEPRCRRTSKREVSRGSIERICELARRLLGKIRDSQDRRRAPRARRVDRDDGHVSTPIEGGHAMLDCLNSIARHDR